MVFNNTIKMALLCYGMMESISLSISISLNCLLCTWKFNKNQIRFSEHNDNLLHEITFSILNG